MKKFLATVLFAAATLTGFSAQAGAIDDAVKAGTLRVGMDPTYMPFEMTDKRGEIIGFEVDILKAMAKSMGVKESRIAFKHILPNVISIILVNITLDFAGCMLTESSLSYLGFGVQQPQPTWGNMLNGANNSIVIQQYWWQWVFPAAIFGICTICINLIGDGLRDALDPKALER